MAGAVLLESRVESKVHEELRARGHALSSGPDWTMKVGGMQGVAVDPAGTFTGGCDPRRDGLRCAGLIEPDRRPEGPRSGKTYLCGRDGSEISAMASPTSRRLRRAVRWRCRQRHDADQVLVLVEYREAPDLQGLHALQHFLGVLLSKAQECPRSCTRAPPSRRRSGPWPTPRTTMSRSVKVPTRRRPAHTGNEADAHRLHGHRRLLQRGVGRHRLDLAGHDFRDLHAGIMRGPQAGCVPVSAGHRHHDPRLRAHMRREVMPATHGEELLGFDNGR
jgi:hypothetical protein